MEEDDVWGNEEDEEIFACIQEMDYINETIAANMSIQNTEPDSIDGELSLLSTANHLRVTNRHHEEFPCPGHNTTELKSEINTLQKKLEEAICFNTDLKNRNYELQGEAGTLRRRLDQQNAERQQQIWQRIHNLEDAKKQESEDRTKLQHDNESLRAQLRLSQIDVQSLEGRNRKLAKRESLGRATEHLAISPSFMTTSPHPPGQSDTVSATSSESFVASTQSTSQHARRIFPTRDSFYSKEVRQKSISAPLSLVPVANDSKEVQTDETIPPIHTFSESDDEDLMEVEKPKLTLSIYNEIKASTKRLITLEIQAFKPIIQKTLKYAPSVFKRITKHKKPRFGLGLEAFDSTALMLQWMDEREMETFDESHDLQAEYFRRLDKIYDPKDGDKTPYLSYKDNENESEVWEDSENMLDNGDDDMDKTESTESQTAISISDLRESDTSEDEYELETSNQTQFDTVKNSELIIPGSYLPKSTPTSYAPDKKRLTFLKEYKLNCRLLSHRNNYKYLKDGQPLEVILEAMNGLYEDAGVWNTLWFIKNELLFILHGKELFQSTRLHVFTTLLVWAKNLWSVITSIEDYEEASLNRLWDKELFDWTEVMLRVVWRPSKSLMDICRELRSIFLHIMSMIIESGHFKDTNENCRRLYLTTLNAIQNPAHHSLQNCHLILNICIDLPLPWICTYFCHKTLPSEFIQRTCFLKELSGRIYNEFLCQPSVLLFERYLDLLDKLTKPADKIDQLRVQYSRKRKLEDDAISTEINSEEVIPQDFEIFKNAVICECKISFIHNYVLMLAEIWKLWQERFRNLELKKKIILDHDEDENRSKRNIYTDILIRSFEPLYSIYKSSENIGSKFGAEVFTYFWNALASYKRFRKYVSLRPDMDEMLSYMTHDEEDERQPHRQGINFPKKMEDEWLKLVTEFPQLNSSISSDDKEN